VSGLAGEARRWRVAAMFVSPTVSWLSLSDFAKIAKIPSGRERRRKKGKKGAYK
jgi:hypothetical protein